LDAPTPRAVPRPNVDRPEHSTVRRRPHLCDAQRLLVARGLRAVADGCISLVLPLYLVALGFDALDVGIIATATLFGSGVLTLCVGWHAHRFRHRTLLLMASAVMAATGLAFAGLSAFVPLLAVAIVGTLNPSSGDVSVFLPLEHAVLSRVVSDRQRTAMFARYSLVGALCGAFGALLAGAPQWASTTWHVREITALQSAFVAYALTGLACALLYRHLSLPEHASSGGNAPGAALTHSHRIVYGLAALFSVDAFAGGFLVQSLLALWLFERFRLSPAAAGVLFFWTGMLSAASYLVAVRIANRIGLLRTMVFTHIPANVLLIAIAFVDSLTWAVVLLLVRSALSQMDVPTRSSYVMSVVEPHERAAAASITAVPRSLAAAAGPFCAGWLLSLTSFGWPLVIAGGLKLAYDLALLVTFRTVRPREER
jgi:MFS family permease